MSGIEQQEVSNKIMVSFLELTQHSNVGDVKEWFPLLEKEIGRSLPKFTHLEGGVYRDKNGVMRSWDGPHYYLCVPTNSTHLLAKYGEYSYSIDKEVDETTFNNKHRIFYWGPGCKPRLEPKRENIIKKTQDYYGGDY